MSAKELCRIHGFKNKMLVSECQMAELRFSLGQFDGYSNWIGHFSCIPRVFFPLLLDFNVVQVPSQTIMGFLSIVVYCTCCYSWKSRSHLSTYYRIQPVYMFPSFCFILLTHPISFVAFLFKSGLFFCRIIYVTWGICFYWCKQTVLANNIKFHGTIFF